MANHTDTTSNFQSIAGAVVLLLLVAAVLSYLQSQRTAPPVAALAALSQAIPGQADAAIAGQDGGFDRLDSSLERLTALRQSAGPAVPGRAADWRELETQGAEVLASRGEVESVTAAAATVNTASLAVLELSNELLDRSGATALIQEFQQRAERMARTAERPFAAAAATGQLGEDLAFLRGLSNALAGETGGDFDVRPIDPQGRELALTPIAGHLTEIETALAVLAGAGTTIGNLDTASAALTAAASRLLDSVPAGSANGGILPGFLSSPWIPIGLVVVGLVLVLVLFNLNRRMSVFERAAAEQAEQNERNQQAILRLLDEMGSLADGDLTVEATVTEDITGTIADSFNYAIEELRKLVTTVNETAIMVESAAKQTETSAANMARAADNQRQEISAATESIVSMASSIEEVSGNAERSSDVARHSVEVAHKGGEAVRRTIDGMNTIRETIQDTSKRIKRLGESSQEIGNIVELINDIAEQTNILALNASIQASMAGEAGRGFAVVADEVQRLAERSTNATKQIEVLVSTIQADTKEAVVSMERSTTDVVGGALLAENAGAALDEIEQVSNQIANLVQNISGSAREQASSAADVTRRTTRLREISEQTGKATTATATAISKLSEFASALRKSVAGFTLPGVAAPPPPPPQAAASKPTSVTAGKQATA